MTQSGMDRNALYLLSRLQRMTRSQFIERITPYGISVPMFSVMFEIDHVSDEVTSSELARRSYVSVQTVNLVVQQLTQRGLVEREPTGRGRGLALSLTAAGKELLHALSAEQVAVIDAMTRHTNMTDDDLRRIFTQLIRSVERAPAARSTDVDKDPA